MNNKMDIESGIDILIDSGNTIIIRLLLSSSLISPEMLGQRAKKFFHATSITRGCSDMREFVLLLREFEILDTELATQIMICLDDMVGDHEQFCNTPIDVINILMEYGVQIDDSLIAKMETNDLIDFVTSSGRLIDFNLEFGCLDAHIVDVSPSTIEWIRTNSCEPYDAIEPLVMHVCAFNMKFFPQYYEYIKHDHEVLDKAIYNMVLSRDCLGRNKSMTYIPTISDHIINDELAFFLYLYFPLTNYFSSSTIQKISHLLPTKVLHYITLSISDKVQDCPETKMLYDRAAGGIYCDMIDCMKKLSVYVEDNFL